jgi:hypothetical protein
MPPRPMHCLRLFLAVGLVALAAVGHAQEGPLALDARAVALCDPPATCEHIGHIRILGALNLPEHDAGGQRLAGLSGLAWDDDDGVLYALSDHGRIFTLLPVFRGDRLVDVRLARSAALIDPASGKPVRWQRSDSEGLDILHGRNRHKGDAELLVSFEREPRIARYRPDGRFIADMPLPPALRDPKQYRGGNKMLESVCAHPHFGILTAPELPLKGDHEFARIYGMDGGSWRFPPGRGGLSALECLPDGDVLVLERELIPLSLRTVVTLRRLHLPAGTAPDTVLAAETVAMLDSGAGLHLDNFEGLAHHRGNRFFMVSDNNDVFIQRTLLVYFEILERQGSSD